MLGTDIFDTATDAVDIKCEGRILQDAVLLNSYIGPIWCTLSIVWTVKGGSVVNR